MTKTKHLLIARRKIANGTASFRLAADHIAAVVEAGATQAEAEAAVGKSQPWVNRLLKWRENGFKEGGPFAEDHAWAIISAANNPAAQPLEVTYAPEPEPKVVHLSISKEPPKAPVVHSGGVAAALLEVKLTCLEQVATELTTEIQLHGGIRWHRC